MFPSACTSQSSSDWISVSLLYQATSVTGTASLRTQLNVTFSPGETSTSVRGCKICRRHPVDKIGKSRPQLQKQIQAREFVNIYAESLDSEIKTKEIIKREVMYITRTESIIEDGNFPKLSGAKINLVMSFFAKKQKATTEILCHD